MKCFVLLIRIIQGFTQALLMLGIVCSEVKAADKVQKEVIEFPQDELESETVLPIFDRINVVKSRNVELENRVEIDFGLGFALTEALYDNKSFFVEGSYHLSDTSSVALMYSSLMEGLSNTGNDLKEGKGLLGGRKFDPSLKPHPKSYLFADYKINAYYGKISLSKKEVMNLNLYGILGAGLVGFGDSQKLGINFGLGNKFYFNKNWALKADLLFLIYNGPNGVLATDNTRSLSSAEVQESIQFQTLLNVGGVFLF